MKSKRIVLIASASVAAAAFGPVAWGTSSNQAADQDNAPRGTAAYGSMTPNPQSGPSSAGAGKLGAKQSGQVRLASQSDDKCTAAKYDNAQVRGNNGENLGNVKDFLVDPSDGTIRFAVVSSGGWMGVGDTLRLVPFTALKQVNRDSSEETPFTVALTKSQWQSLPSLAEDKFEEGQIQLSQTQARQLAQAFSTEASRASANPNLVRASKIRGLDITAQNQDIGSIEDVIVRPGDSNALALLDPDDDFAGGEQKYLVPVSDLQLTGNGSAHTTLTKQDFRSANRSNSSTAMNDNTTSSSQSESTQQNASATSGTTASAYPLNATSAHDAYAPKEATSSNAAVASNDASTASSSATASVDANSNSSVAATGTNSTSADVSASVSANQTNANADNASSSVATNDTDSNSAKASDSATASGANADRVRVETPTPTGFSSADQMPTTSDKLIDGAQAIRRALDRDTTMSHENVTIVPENGKIVLRGTVASDDLKSKIENLANTAGAPNVVISNLKVQQQ